MGRFIKLNAYEITVDGEVVSFDLMINPFQIESYIETDLNFHDDVISQVKPCIKLTTKSGIDHNILMNIGEFEKAIE
jgi:hypothetical protein